MCHHARVQAPDSHYENVTALLSTAIGPRIFTEHPDTQTWLQDYETPTGKTTVALDPKKKKKL
jgi:hypothetical protein